MLSNLVNWNSSGAQIELGLRHMQYTSFSFDVSLQDCWLVLCSGWVHARRYYEQALDQDKARASYIIEREIKNASPEDRKEQRLQKSLPIINKLG